MIPNQYFYFNNDDQSFFTKFGSFHLFLNPIPVVWNTGKVTNSWWTYSELLVELHITSNSNESVLIQLLVSQWTSRITLGKNHPKESKVNCFWYRKILVLPYKFRYFPHHQTLLKIQSSLRQKPWVLLYVEEHLTIGLPLSVPNLDKNKKY